MIDPLPVIPLDEDETMRAGRRIGALESSAFNREKGEAVIGATADVAGEGVLTRNVEDFERLGFEVESY